MSVRTELWGLAISGTLCWVGFVLTVVNANPSTGQASLISFYLSLFIGLLTLVTLAGYFLRRYRLQNEIKYRLMRESFRQGFLIAALVVSCLLLQAARLLSWWDIILLLTVGLLTELYLRSYART